MAERDDGDMATPTPARLLIARGLALFVVLAPLVIWFLGRDNPDLGGLGGVLVFGASNLAFAALAVLLITRKNHPVGWLLMLLGATGALSAIAFAYSTHGAGADQLGTLPGAVVVQWMSEQLWLVQVTGQGIFIPLLFPDGRLPSRRWRHAFRLIILGAVLMWMPLVFARTLYIDDSIAAPLASLAPPEPVIASLEAAGQILLVFGFVTMISSLVVRWRRGDPLERQQLRWLFAGLLPLILAQVLFGVFDLEEQVGPIANVLWVLAYFALPVSMTVAILQYRLYDLGRLIRRTAAYTIVSGLLAGIYGLSVLGISSLLPSSDSGVSVAGATMLAVLAARPLHRRIRHELDHRFNRRAYDARQAVDALQARLSSQLDVGAVTHELLTAAAGSIEPTTLSVWVRVDE